MTIPAFEAEDGLLALVPNSALQGAHADITFVVVGKSPGSTTLVAELKSASSRLNTAPRRKRRASGSLDVDVRAFVSYSGADHSAGASATAALLSRLTRALTRAAGMAGDEGVHRALERPSDMGAIVDLLRSALPLLSAEQELDPELNAGVEALAAEDDLIRQAGGLKDGKWVSGYLAISPKSVAAKARRNELLAVTRGDRNLYPAFQFRDGQVVPGVRSILQALPLTNGWPRLSFLLSPDPGLDHCAPFDAFQADPDAVLALAAAADTQGAS